MDRKQRHLRNIKTFFSLSFKINFLINICLCLCEILNDLSFSVQVLYLKVTARTSCFIGVAKRESIISHKIIWGNFLGCSGVFLNCIIVVGVGRTMWVSRKEVEYYLQLQKRIQDFWMKCIPNKLRLGLSHSSVISQFLSLSLFWSLNSSYCKLGHHNLASFLCAHLCF